MEKQQPEKPQDYIQRVSMAKRRKERAQECVKRVRDLASHLEYVAQLCEAGDHGALLACGRLEKEIIKLRNSLIKDVPQDVEIRVNYR